MKNFKQKQTEVMTRAEPKPWLGWNRQEPSRKTRILFGTGKVLIYRAKLCFIRKTSSKCYRLDMLELRPLQVCMSFLHLVSQHKFLVYKIDFNLSYANIPKIKKSNPL